MSHAHQLEPHGPSHLAPPPQRPPDQGHRDEVIGGIAQGAGHAPAARPLWQTASGCEPATTVRMTELALAVANIVEERVRAIDLVESAVAKDPIGVAAFDPSAAVRALEVATMLVANLVAGRIGGLVASTAVGAVLERNRGLDSIAGLLDEAFQGLVHGPVGAAAPGVPERDKLDEGGRYTADPVADFFERQRGALRALRTEVVLGILRSGGAGAERALSGLRLAVAASGPEIFRAQAQATRAQYYGGRLATRGRMRSGGADLGHLQGQLADDGAPTVRARGLVDVEFAGGRQPGTVPVPVRASILGVDEGTALDIAKASVLEYNFPLRASGRLGGPEALNVVITRNEAGDIQVGGRDRLELGWLVPSSRLGDGMPDEAEMLEGARRILAMLFARPIRDLGLPIHATREVMTSDGLKVEETAIPPLKAAGGAR
jgi:hypothetical protein